MHNSKRKKKKIPIYKQTLTMDHPNGRG